MMDTATQEPLVSVLVSVYNHERYIEECLRSIAAQKVNFAFEVLEIQIDEFLVDCIVQCMIL